MDRSGDDWPSWHLILRSCRFKCLDPNPCILGQGFSAVSERRGVERGNVKPLVTQNVALASKPGVGSLDGVSLQRKDLYDYYFDHTLFFPLSCAFNVYEQLMVISGEEISLMWCNIAKRVGSAFFDYAILGVTASSPDRIRWQAEGGAASCRGRTARGFGCQPGGLAPLVRRT